MHALEQYRTTLAESVVFAHLSPAELDLIMMSCRLVDVSAGQTLLSLGGKDEGLYVILEGNIEFFLPARSMAECSAPAVSDSTCWGPAAASGSTE